jgi:hypothetical protein
MNLPINRPESIDADFESSECQVPVSERAADDPKSQSNKPIVPLALCDRLSFPQQLVG